VISITEYVVTVDFENPFSDSGRLASYGAVSRAIHHYEISHSA